jgi:Lon-like protease
VGAAVVVFVVILGLHFWNLSEYAITPGNATPVGPLVKIHGVSSTTHQGAIMLADVDLQSLNAWTWLTLHFSSHVQFVSTDELVDPGVSTNELLAQGFLQMSDSKQAAEVTAFRSFGWKVPATPSGAVITAVESPSPASSAGLRVADEVVGINSTPVDSGCDLVRATHKLAPGTSVKLSVDRAVISKIGLITYRSSTTVRLTTGAAPSGLASSGCSGVTGSNPSFLGVSLEDGTNYQLPAKVSINTANIGGPSAGLAMTLTLINKLSRTSISGNLPIAATGTIDVHGNVGDVGGVAEKTVAVQRAGAKYFIVPQVEVATAKGAAGPGLRIIGVTTLAQALRDLRALGGVTPVALTPPQ